MNIALDADWRVLAFTSAVAVLACALFGLTPAIRSTRVHPAVALSANGRGQAGNRERFAFQRVLTVFQMAVSLVLLVAAFLLVQSFCNLITVHPGFRQDGILVVWANFGRQPAGRHEVLKTELLEKIRSIPQVEAAAITSHVPLYGSSWTMGGRDVQGDTLVFDETGTSCTHCVKEQLQNPAVQVSSPTSSGRETIQKYEIYNSRRELWQAQIGGVQLAP